MREKIAITLVVVLATLAIIQKNQLNHQYRVVKKQQETIGYLLANLRTVEVKIVGEAE
jgi:lipopolysaccharide export system protein LptC